jgi:hypothetical protein
MAIHFAQRPHNTHGSCAKRGTGGTLKIPLAVLFGALGFSGLSNAQTFHKATAYYDFHYYAYEEPGVMTVKSLLPAISVGYRDETAIRGTQEFGELSWAIEGALGYTEYSGSGTDKHNFYKLLGEISTPVYQNFYLGLGYRRLIDDFGPGTTSTGLQTYDRISQYFYVPVGVVVQGNDGSSTKLQYNYLMYGHQISYLSQVGGYLNDLHNTQSSGYGLDLAYTSKGGKWEAYIRYWKIGHSDYVPALTINGPGSAYEPENNTVEIGARVAF